MGDLLLLGVGRSSGAAPFSPEDIAGLELWAKADAITGLSDGQAISTWPDSSGNGRNFAQATGSKQPTFQTAEQNGLPGVQFASASSQEMAAALTNNDQTRTIFVVVEALVTTNGQGVMGWGNANTRVVSNGTDQGFTWHSAIPGSSGAGAKVITLRFNGLTSLDRYAGTGTASNEDPNDTYASGTLTNFLIGGTGGTFFDGLIYELLVYDSALSDADRIAVRDYLMDKWGLV